MVAVEPPPPGILPRQKLWLERGDGGVVMSDYRLRLLEHVAETGSLAQAAGLLELSYRRAWGKVRELEENLGYKVVESVVGGAGGGRTLLTPEGRALVAAYGRFQRRARQAVDAIFAEEVAPVLIAPRPDTESARPGTLE